MSDESKDSPPEPEFDLQRHRREIEALEQRFRESRKEEDPVRRDHRIDDEVRQFFDESQDALEAMVPQLADESGALARVDRDAIERGLEVFDAAERMPPRPAPAPNPTFESNHGELEAPTRAAPTMAPPNSSGGEGLDLRSALERLKRHGLVRDEEPAGRTLTSGAPAVAPHVPAPPSPANAAPPTPPPPPPAMRPTSSHGAGGAPPAFRPPPRRPDPVPQAPAQVPPPLPAAAAPPAHAPVAPAHEPAPRHPPTETEAYHGATNTDIVPPAPVVQGSRRGPPASAAAFAPAPAAIPAPPVAPRVAAPVVAPVAPPVVAKEAPPVATAFPGGTDHRDTDVRTPPLRNAEPSAAGEQDRLPPIRPSFSGAPPAAPAASAPPSAPAAASGADDVSPSTSFDQLFGAVEDLVRETLDTSVSEVVEDARQSEDSMREAAVRGRARRESRADERPSAPDAIEDLRRAVLDDRPLPPLSPITNHGARPQPVDDDHHLRAPEGAAGTRTKPLSAVLPAPVDDDGLEEEPEREGLAPEPYDWGVKSGDKPKGAWLLGSEVGDEEADQARRRAEKAAAAPVEQLSPAELVPDETQECEEIESGGGGMAATYLKGKVKDLTALLEPIVLRLSDEGRLDGIEVPFEIHDTSESGEFSIEDFEDRGQGGDLEPLDPMKLVKELRDLQRLRTQLIDKGLVSEDEV